MRRLSVSLMAWSQTLGYALQPPARTSLLTLIDAHSS